MVDGALAETLSAADFPAIWQLLKSHEKILRGNGRPGLVEDVAVLRPLAEQLNTHLRDFNAAEIKSRVERQSLFEKLESLGKDMKVGFKTVFDRLKPVEETSTRYFKAMVTVGTISAIVGAVFTFVISNWDKIKGVFQ